MEAVVEKLNAQGQLAEMGGQEASTMLWALASMMGGGEGGSSGVRRGGLHTLVPPICERITSISTDMNATDLVNTLWGLATINQK